MKREYLDFLKCPVTGEDLKLNVYEVQGKNN